ncbi:DEKNAAC101872 [Brettanomyces naardenensis]|uniref:DEKNAAC101872 n=1 Tax=Brettanomyces naardenensis TaxID=13370 RepID=A0A448YIY7_BRENA|nr:DEKNAAC101872 [Brettanomyces naardenensis]
MARKKHPSITLTIHRNDRGDEEGNGETTTSGDLALDNIPRKKLVDFYSSTIEGVINLKDDTSHEYIAGPFLKLPSKKVFPDYYDIVAEPISLNDIKVKTNLRKTKVAEFPSIGQFVDLFRLMSDNAVTYNGSDSLIAKDAKHIYEFVKNQCEEFKKVVEKKPPAEVKEETNDVSRRESSVIDESDYSVELSKVVKSVINYKSSHHKNSTRLALPFMDAVDAREYPDYYTVVKKGMCFNEIEMNLDRGDYQNGRDGVQKFIDDVDLVFKNACLYNAPNSVIYKDAETLQNFFTKRMVKFKTQFWAVRKRGRGRPPSVNATAEIKREDSKKRKVSVIEPAITTGPKRRGRKSKKQKLLEEEMEKYHETAGESGTDNSVFDDYDTSNVSGTVEPPVAALVPAIPSDAPSFIRKHDIEKAEDVEAVDDITAFIKRFTFSSAIKQYSTYTSEVMQYFEHCMIEPAGNSTIGGSTYSITLPADEILGQPLIVLVSLQNKIIDEKHFTELKVNKETMKPQPLTISYDEEDEDGEFVACKFEFKLGVGLNLFEFKLRVPFPLKGRKTEEEKAKDLVAKAAADVDGGRVTRSTYRRTEDSFEESSIEEEEVSEELKNDSQQYFQESVKVWVKVA